jgi:type II secretory pathway component PulK
MTACRRSGAIMIVVLVLTAMTAMVAASLLFRMRAEIAASSSGSSGEQAYAAAMSGMQRALSLLSITGQDVYDNPDMFRNQLVCDDGANRWYFTVCAGNVDGKTLRFGLDSEGGKINLNTADATTLGKLFAHFPDADAQGLADCLLDYIDSDSNPRSHGAEQDFYDMLRYPYMIHNGPLATMEELLLVNGFTPAMVFGQDVNFNGILDPNEDDGDASFPPDKADGQLDRGLMGLATVSSYQRNVDSKGQARININGTDAELDELSSLGLPAETVNFIRTYRSEGNTFGHPSDLLMMTYTTKNASTSTSQPGDGKDGSTSMPAGTNIKSGVSADQLSIVLDRLTTLSGQKRNVSGLVDINQASAEVLAMLPGIDDALAQTIVENRGMLDEQKKGNIAWLYEQDLVSADRFKEIAPRLTAHSYQYRVLCVGFGVPSGRYRVMEAILDLAGSSPRISYLRDVTRNGMPVSLVVDNDGGSQ